MPPLLRTLRTAGALGLAALSLSGCASLKLSTRTSETTIQLSRDGYPQDGTRDWIVRDSVGTVHRMQLVQENVVPGLRRITLRDSGLTLYVINEWWSKGMFGWHLDTRDLVKFSPVGDSLVFHVTPNRRLFEGILRRAGRPVGYNVISSPGDEANGEGCSAKAVSLLAASVKLNSALIDLAIEPTASTYLAVTTNVTLAGAAYDSYSKCLVKQTVGS